MPGPLTWTLAPGQCAHLICSTEPIDFDRAIEQANALATVSFGRSSSRGDDAGPVPPLPNDDLNLDSLLTAADEFVTAGADGAARIVPNYPWSPPSGRDALISFTGLLLVPRRFAEARSLLESLASTLHRGLIASEFPEDGSSPLYLSADASLWW